MAQGPLTTPLRKARRGRDTPPLGGRPGPLDNPPAWRDGHLEHDAAHDITALLAALRRGERAAMDELMPLVYDELRRRAHRQLSRSGSRRTLDTTGLVHEAYLRLVRLPNPAWEDRFHFFSVAAKAMRSVVVDYARRSLAQKRGGAARQVDLDEGLLRVEDDAAELLALHEALGRLESIDARLSELVELRFFGGLSIEETARQLDVSDRTVKRDWTKARILLMQLLHEAR